MWEHCRHDTVVKLLAWDDVDVNSKDEDIDPRPVRIAGHGIMEPGLWDESGDEG
jgi:hypothetical protein